MRPEFTRPEFTKPGLTKLGLIGNGSIVRQTLACLSGALERPLDRVICLARPQGAERARALLDGFGAQLAHERIVVHSVEDLLEAAPDLVAEAAGHAALASAGVATLAGGCELIVVSAGALADDALHAGLDRAAAAARTRWSLCPGAIGGLDILAAARLSGLSEVIYTSRKPPAAWRGTAAEKLLDLDALTAPRMFYEGPARAAARDYPQNANVAATIALAGAGFERTHVRLIADPGVSRNAHEIQVRSACADFSIRIDGMPSPDNPRTSLTTGYALAAQIIRTLRERAFAI